MANKKRKHNKTTHRRRRRISGIGGNMNELIGIAVGAAVAPFIDKGIAKVMPSLTDKKILAAAKVALGVFVLPKISRNPMISAASKGVVAISAVQLASGLGLYPGGAGIGDPDGDVYLDMNNIAGTGDDPVGVEVVSGLPNYYPNINGVSNPDDFETE